MKVQYVISELQKEANKFKYYCFSYDTLITVPCNLSGSKFHCKKTVQNVQTLHHYFTYLREFYFSLVHFLRGGGGRMLLTTLN